MATDLDTVRRIIRGEEFDDLVRLREQYNDDAQFTEHVARVLARAITQRLDAGDDLARALAPAMDEALITSVRADPQRIADSLYPVMGPAIRKSISEALQQLLDNLNRLLEDSVSPRSLRWRITAWRTGQRYAEVALSNMLEYRVEQVFVIHGETSLLLQHHIHESSEARDPDLVSGMFSAIQDFIQDSFATGDGESLNALRLGDVNVVVERGPLVVVAAVVRGHVPDHLRDDMQSSLEILHAGKREVLEDYDGDASAFTDLEPEFRRLLQFKRRDDVTGQDRKRPWLALLAIGVVLAGLIYWQYRDYRVDMVVSDWLTRLDAEPGIVVLDADRDGPEVMVTLLRDPLAIELESLELDPQIVMSHKVYPYVSSDDAIVQMRASRALTLPEQSTLVVAGGVLKVTGELPIIDYQQLQARWPLIEGVSRADLSGVTVIEPPDPMALAKQRAAVLIAGIEAWETQFEKGAVVPSIDDADLQTIVTQIREYADLREQLGETPGLMIIGYTDNSGSYETNRRVGLARAAWLRDRLITGGLLPSLFTLHAGVDTDPGRQERIIRIQSAAAEEPSA